MDWTGFAITGVVAMLLTTAAIHRMANDIKNARHEFFDSILISFLLVIVASSVAISAVIPLSASVDVLRERIELLERDSHPAKTPLTPFRRPNGDIGELQS